MDNPQAALRQFFCANCGVQLRAKAAMQGQRMPCPKCRTVITVPHFDASRPPGENPSAGEIYGVRETEHPRDVKSSPDYAETGSEEDGAGEDEEQTERIISARPKPPPWPLLQGVLSFLAEPSAIIYWFVLSFLNTLFFSMLFGSLALLNVPSPATWMGSVICMAISFVLGLLVVLFNAINCLAIVQESAAGNRAIEEWPGLMIFDLLGESLVFINSAIIAAVTSWFVTLPLREHENARALCEFSLIIILFPILLLSMLEAGSFLLPASAAVWQSIRRSWRTWLVFYAESFFLAFAFVAYLAILTFAAGRFVKDITIESAVLIVALGVGPGVLLEMVYFRLMGRLAWVCDEDSRRELAEAEAAEKEEQKREETGEIREPPVDDF